MTRTDRIELITEIEKQRKSRLIAYLTGDRGGYSIGSIQEDAVPKLNNLLDRIGKTKTIDLLLYSRGGATHVPWKIVSLIREHCEEFNVLIPFRAHSAATMIALGADSIVCGPAAELGPIDPSLTTPFGPKDKDGNPVQIGSETINSYISFLKSHLKLRRADVAKEVDLLINRTDPLAIGEVYRLHNYIRLTSRKLLNSAKGRTGATEDIIRVMVEEMYYHGHAITRRDARSIGLNIVDADSPLETVMWALFEQYAHEMKLDETFNAFGYTEANKFAISKDIGRVAFLESADAGFCYEVELRLSPQRQLPQGINLNVNIQLPQAVIQALQQNPQLQALVSQILQASLPQVQQQVMNQLNDQAPIVGVDVKTSRNDWTAT